MITTTRITVVKEDVAYIHIVVMDRKKNKVLGYIDKIGKQEWVCIKAGVDEEVIHQLFKRSS